MNILALDTSTLHAALALARVDGEILVAPSDVGRRHASGLIPAVRDLLAKANLTVLDLDLLAVGLGPGSYTGLRIGVAAAKTLAYVTGRPLVGLDSLEAVAQNASDDALKVSVVADAQRGDLYVADFSRERAGAPLLRSGPTRVEPAETWRTRLESDSLVLGPALDRPGFERPASARTADPALNRPNGARLVGLARELFNQGHREDPWFLEPVYLRRSAAEDKWDAPKQP